MGTLASELRPMADAFSDGPRVYVDANVPSGIVTVMRHELGWDVLFVLEHDDLRRAPDLTHFHRAIDLGRTLITLDHDFFDDKRFPPGVGPGIIICSVPDERALRRLLTHLDRTVLRSDEGGVVSLRGRKIHLTPDDVIPALRI